VLFPGFLTIGLAAVGVWAGLYDAPVAKKPDSLAPPEPAETVVLYLLIGGFALLVSTGPDGGLYALLRAILPAFSLLRAPARIGIVVTLALTVLAAVGLRAILPVGRSGRLLAAGLTVAAALELAAVPLPGRPVPPVSDAYRLLARLPRGPVAEFPFFYVSEVYFRHVYYLLNSTAHWNPLINGYSDYIPPDFQEMVVPMSSFPAREAFHLLKAREARYVIFHLDFYDAPSRRRLLEAIDEYRPYLRPLWQRGDEWLFEIVGFPE
jgi:hypothetical protein